MGLNLASVVLPGAVLAALSPWIMSQYGEGFREGWPVMVVCMATTVLISISSPLSNVIVATGKMWMGFLLNVIWAAILLASTRMLLPHGAMGLALAYIIAYFFHDISNLLYVYFGILRKGPPTMEKDPAPSLDLPLKGEGAVDEQ
jgi:O-antigen/teichoic acid export membrane protein